MRHASLALLLLAGSATGRGDGGPIPRDLAGKPLATYPHFRATRTFDEGDPVRIAFDTRQEPELLRRIDVYLIEHERLAAHLAGEKLESLTGAPLTFDPVLGGVEQNQFLLDAGTLKGSSSADAQGTFLLGKGYDVVIDVDRDGALDEHDVVDGSVAEAGFYVVEDYVTFNGDGTKETGPYAVTEVVLTTLDPRLDVYFPTDIANLGALPLITVSHGNGHNYQWYDHIGYHMASWGYVVMSHVNNTGPGIETASTSTLRASELLLGSLGTIAGGVLDGHVDGHRIVWIGHSRGGEGVVRAYRRLANGSPIATHYALADIKLVSSIAPTDFLGPTSSNMGAAPYHLWTGGADADVNGCADCDICQTFHLLERADGTRFSASLHGAGHGAFHDGGGSLVASGPCQLGRPATHAIMRSILLPLVQTALDGNPACLDYLTRQWEEFRALGAPDPTTSPCYVVDLIYAPGPERTPLVVDDFQSEPAHWRSSSGGAVRYSRGIAGTIAEGRLDDANRNFTASESDPMNGMTFAGPGDTAAGAVLEWNSSDEWLMFEVPAGGRDLRAFRTLSFRAAQSTRDPLTTAELGDLDFAVRLTDAELKSSTIRIGAYGGGVEEPYQRGGCGSGHGWANEFETIRVPLADFRSGGHPLDLSNVVAITFLFGPSSGSPSGRLGLDEVEFTRE